MAEETTKVTHEAEKIAPKEGTVEAEIVKTADVKPEEVIEAKTNTQSETVPLSVYLGLKDDVKALKKEIKEAKESSKSNVFATGAKELAEKYPDVSKDFINDILTSATTQAQLEIEKKYTPLIEKQDIEKKKDIFDKAFTKVFDKAVDENPDLPKNIDKELIKTLSLTPDYRNTPISEILTKLYGGMAGGKSTSENDTRTAGDSAEEVVDFSKITKEQKDKVLADPKSREKYFKYLDTL